jgi:hypothetical protein
MALMAEPGAASDETAAVEAGKTIAVPNPTPTDAVEVAWAGDDGPGEATQIRDVPDISDEFTEVRRERVAIYQSWGTAWGRAAALLVVGLGLAGAIVLGFWALSGPRSETKASPPPAPTASATTSAPAAAPSSITSTADQDGKYLQDLNDRGIAFANPGAAIYNGKTVCQNLGQGMTVQQVTAAFRETSPAFSDNADAFVGISVRAYCPQYTNQVAAP